VRGRCSGEPRSGGSSARLSAPRSSHCGQMASAMSDGSGAPHWAQCPRSLIDRFATSETVMPVATEIHRRQLQQKWQSLPPPWLLQRKPPMNTNPHECRRDASGVFAGATSIRRFRECAGCVSGKDLDAVLIRVHWCSFVVDWTIAPQPPSTCNKYRISSSISAGFATVCPISRRSRAR